MFKRKRWLAPQQLKRRQPFGCQAAVSGVQEVGFRKVAGVIEVESGYTDGKTKKTKL